jgi:hypothetical protein
MRRSPARSLQTAFGPVARATSLGAALSLCGVCLGAGIQACSSDADRTGGKVVSLQTRVEVDETAAGRFTSASGWDVTLSKAWVSAGSFYYFDGAPPLVRRERRDPWQYAARLLGLGEAHAHPGHYQAGNALGQMLGAQSVDLLDGPAELPDGGGISGVYRSARFSFAAPSGDGADALDGHVALAEGKAEKDGESPRFFRAFADLKGVEKSAAAGQIDGCEFREHDVESDGTVTVTVNPKIWFDLVDFSEAEVGSADAPAELPEGSQPQIAFVLGTTQLSAYNFRFDARRQ